MKKIAWIIAGIIILAGSYAAWNLFGATVTAPETKYFCIPTGSTYNRLKESLTEQKIIRGHFFFDLLSKQLKLSSNVKPGRYEIKDKSSLLSLIRLLKSGKQTPVRLVINKIRTKEDLASRIGANFEADSTEAIRFLTSNDSLSRYGLDTNTVMTIVIPNSYLFYWNGSFNKIFGRLKDQHDKFWQGKRTEKAKALGLSAVAIYTIASIVEEETNKETDKGLIASVYINRLNKGMKLQADPTVKYAMRNFGLKRILYGHLQYPSPYNTYQQTGLPPGPICTPSINTIDAVLDAPQTEYIFFVAKPDFNGYSNFADNYTDHQKFAKAYQKALDSLIRSKAEQNQAVKK
jgi:UPF0755 protein